MACPVKDVQTLGQTDQSLRNRQSVMAMATRIAGKTIEFDVDLFMKRAMNDDFDDVSPFEDWTLYTYTDDSGTPIAFVNFSANLDGRSRSSKRENALNPVIAGFLTQYPRMTPKFPPPPMQQ